MFFRWSSLVGSVGLIASAIICVNGSLEFIRHWPDSVASISVEHQGKRISVLQGSQKVVLLPNPDKRTIEINGKNLLSLTKGINREPEFAYLRSPETTILPAYPNDNVFFLFSQHEGSLNLELVALTLAELAKNSEPSQKMLQELANYNAILIRAKMVADASEIEEVEFNSMGSEETDSNEETEGSSCIII